LLRQNSPKDGYGRGATLSNSKDLRVAVRDLSSTTYYSHSQGRADRAEPSAADLLIELAAIRQQMKASEEEHKTANEAREEAYQKKLQTTLEAYEETHKKELQTKLEAQKAELMEAMQVQMNERFNHLAKEFQSSRLQQSEPETALDKKHESTASTDSTEINADGATASDLLKEQEAQRSPSGQSNLSLFAPGSIGNQTRNETPVQSAAAVQSGSFGL
jgi:hypothetical protein